MKKVVVLLVLVAFQFAQAQEKPSSLILNDLIRLELSGADYAPKQNKITGSTFWGDQLLFVVGTRMNEEIFIKSKTNTLEPWARHTEDLSVRFMNEFVKPLKEKTKYMSTGDASKDPLYDFQGVAICSRSEKPSKQTAFVVNGYTRDILQYEIEEYQIKDFKNLTDVIYKDLENRDSKEKINQYLARDPGSSDYLQTFFYGPEGNKFDQNGFKGIAVDCLSNTLYVAKTKEPAYVLSADINTGVIVNMFPVLGSKSGVLEGEIEISDIAFMNNELFILDRTSSKIVQINTSTEEWIATHDFSAYDRTFADVGTAQTLAVQKIKDKKRFVIGFEGGALNEKGVELFGCSEANLADKDKKRYLGKKNCLQPGATNAVLLEFSN